MRHVEYIHYNPVKHDYVRNVIDLPKGIKALFIISRLR